MPTAVTHRHLVLSMSLLTVHCIVSYVCGRPQEGESLWLNADNVEGDRFLLYFCGRPSWITYLE